MRIAHTAAPAIVTGFVAALAIGLSTPVIAAETAQAVPSATAAGASAPATTSLSFTFETGAATGKIMVALYNSADTWAGGAPVRAVQVDVAAGQHEAVFADLPAGDYGIKAFHDVDGDGKMNTNPFGMPTEPFAFSNNARGNMGPASWDRAHFAASGAVTQTVVIR